EHRREEVPLERRVAPPPSGGRDEADHDESPEEAAKGCVAPVLHAHIGGDPEDAADEREARVDVERHLEPLSREEVQKKPRKSDGPSEEPARIAIEDRERDRGC